MAAVVHRLRGLLADWLAALGAWRLGFAVFTALLLGWAGPQLAAIRRPRLDEQLLDGVHGLIPEPLGNLLLRVYQMSGVHLTAVLVLAVLIFLSLKRLWPELVCLVVGTGGILVIVDRWLKPLFDRRRPSGRLLEDISGRSFPSGHAAGSVVFYFLTCCLLSAHYPRLRRPLFVFSSCWVALVWLSTLYCRAHWLSDIAAGAAVGYVWLSFCLAGFTVWEQRCRPSLPPSPMADASVSLADLRGLRSAPELDAAGRESLSVALMPLLERCDWFTVGVMAPSADAAVQALRALESALGWPAHELDPAGEALGSIEGPVFLKANQNSGRFLVRREAGLGEGLLITGHSPADPDAEDTWGPLPLNFFAA